MQAVPGESTREVGDPRSVLCDAKAQAVVLEDAAVRCAPPPLMIKMESCCVLTTQCRLMADGAPGPRTSPPPDRRVGAAAPPRGDGPRSRASVQTRVLDLDRFGSLNKATRVTDWVPRFVRNARGVSRCGERDLTEVEITDARNALFRLVQAESFMLS